MMDVGDDEKDIGRNINVAKSPSTDVDERKLPIEMDRLMPPNPADGTPGEADSMTGGSASYGSTLTIGADASETNLLRIDLERKFSRHTGEERVTWDNRAQFVLSLIGYAVGLGNVWRFPYLTQKNGGGAFLIPYAVMLAIEGIPLFFLELAIGQRLRKGAIGAWNEVSPYLGGLGICSAIVSFYLALYYNTIMSWCLVYLFQSFQSPLPWAACPHTFGDNDSYVIEPECEKSSPPSYFWYRSTLNTAPTIESIPEFNWKIALGLLMAWVIVFLCILKGIQTTGKVVYVTATFPYLVLVAFFFRGITLEGFDRGLEHLFVPEWHRLLDPAVWLDAATQIFYSFGLAFGCLIALASYNPVRSDFLRDTLVVTVCDFLTSIFTAVVVFCVLGFKATMHYKDCLSSHGLDNTTDPHTLDVNHTCNFKKIIEESGSGTGLAFIAFTEAINQFPLAPIWAVLFFLMLMTLGLDSMFGTLEGAITSLNDLMLFPRARKEVVCGSVCLFCLVVSMSFATSTGPYVFALFDSFSANIPLLVVGFMECVAISYVYGLKQISEDIELMLGKRPSYFWLISWRYVMPLAVLVIFVSSLIEIFSEGIVYEAWDADKGIPVVLPWPWWCRLLAAALILSSILWIPGVALARRLGYVPLADETPAFFPTDELREEHSITPHKDTQFERVVLGFRE
ncbi:sodium-dependent neutral amino acid transporter B(0)AT3-like [Aplysia californica]|uniref:Transporter n=1 Tax=Aplysia californica TaxID=6500 RepID=A0ABM0K4V2_APLCA|nr:sodium-dependent neutral amino acid transporter B(0)AT3-like [Aplysia californica]